MHIFPVETLRTMVGQETGVSQWIPIDQLRIDQFADATEDRQFIHVDVEGAARTEFGGTIAHGLLTLSLLPRLGAEGMVMPEGLKLAINYGFERVRFLAPVRSGKQVRGRFVLDSLEEKGPGKVLIGHRVTVEIEGEDKPALTALWLCYFVL